MFDLPVITDKERKIALKFRNFLLDDGFIMMQYSVYSRICKNSDDLNKHLNRVKAHSPTNGDIRLLQVTEKQYNDMIMLCGEKKVEEGISTNNMLIF
jgi:CRISPR-associated protein Cas2